MLRAQIEEDRLRTQIANLEDSRNPLMAQFKAALGLKAEDPAPPMPQRFESTPLDLSADKLFATALAQNTRLKAMEAEVRAAEAAIALARQVAPARFQPGIHGRREDEPDALSAAGQPGDRLAPDLARQDRRPDCRGPGQQALGARRGSRPNKSLWRWISPSGLTCTGKPRGTLRC